MKLSHLNFTDFTCPSHLLPCHLRCRAMGFRGIQNQITSSNHPWDQGMSSKSNQDEPLLKDWEFLQWQTQKKTDPQATLQLIWESEGLSPPLTDLLIASHINLMSAGPLHQCGCWISYPTDKCPKEQRNQPSHPLDILCYLLKNWIVSYLFCWHFAPHWVYNLIQSCPIQRFQKELLVSGRRHSPASRRFQRCFQRR